MDDLGFFATQKKMQRSSQTKLVKLGMLEEGKDLGRWRWRDGWSKMVKVEEGKWRWVSVCGREMGSWRGKVGDGLLWGGRETKSGGG